MRALIKFSEAKVDWDLNIDAALYAYRISKQASSQFSPFFLMYNRNPRKAILTMNWVAYIGDTKKVPFRSVWGAIKPGVARAFSRLTIYF